MGTTDFGGDTLSLPSGNHGLDVDVGTGEHALGVEDHDGRPRRIRVEGAHRVQPTQGPLHVSLKNGRLPWPDE